MDAVTEVAKPGGDGFGIEVLDAGVVVIRRDDGAGDGDPVLRGGVLEGELGGFVVGDVGELGRVLVGEEEEVRAFALWRCYLLFFVLHVACASQAQ